MPSSYMLSSYICISKICLIQEDWHLPLESYQYLIIFFVQIQSFFTTHYEIYPIFTFLPRHEF